MVEADGQNIRIVDIEEQVKSAYLDYAMSVITARALPDVRDGLKPVQRRILYGMLEAGVRANTKHKKSASVVGDVMKKYHPHGDAAIYDALARMAQPWNMRYPLVDGQGNFGSVDGDPPAAMRYCVTGDTLVVTDRGVVPVAELSPKESEDIDLRVLSRDGKVNPASRWWSCGPFPTRHVRTRRGYEITGTLNHPLLVAAPDPVTGQVRLAWKLVADIRPGDHVALDRSDTFWPEQPVAVADHHPRLADGSRTVRQVLPTLLDEDLAFLIGALLAEGTFQTERIEFTQTHGDFAAAFEQTWRRVFPTCRLHVFEREPVSYGKKRFLQMQVVSRHVVPFLRNLRLRGRSAERTIPEVILRSPQSVVAAFLRALFEGDGSVEQSGRSLLRVSLSARNRSMLRQLQTLLLRFGIVSAVAHDRRRDQYRLYIQGRRNLAAFREKIGLVSAVKQDALARILAVHTDRALSGSDFVPFLADYARANARRGQREWLAKHNFDRVDRLTAVLPRLEQALSAEDFADVEQLARNRYLFERVVSVEDAGEQPVYSLRVDSECHSFVANGFVNHNTEVRLSPLAEEMLHDIDKDTVNFAENYDGEYREPVVLPSRIPNLLLNGASGIAVGMATNIPPYNLIEICQALEHIIDHWDNLDDVTPDELMKFVQGPDFPTGGFILGREGIQQAFATGKGRVVMRARAHIDELKGGKTQIVVTELPFQVNKASLIEKIAELVRDKRINDIADLRDESDRRGMSIVIELKRTAQPKKVLNQLLKFTQMQFTFGVNMLALVDGEPRMLGLKAVLRLFVQHRQEVLTRRSRFELAKAEQRAHILEGLLVAFKHLDEVIQTIRGAKDAEHARRELIKTFKLSEEQAQAILDMQLRRLAALERRKIEDEYKETIKRIAYLQDLLANPRKILFLIRDDLKEVMHKYGDERRTIIMETEDHEFSAEDYIGEEDVLVSITQRGYIKRVKAETFRAQRRGGKGITGTVTRDEDEVEHLFVANTHDTIVYFTNRGRAFASRCFEIPDASRTARGLPLINLIMIENGEKVTACVPVAKGNFEEPLFLTMGTRQGMIKRTSLSDFAAIRANGLICMGLAEGDELGWARLSRDEDEVIMVSRNGQAIRFSMADVRPMGRQAGGVRGMRLAKGDRVVTMDLATDGSELLTVTEGAYGKRSPLADYPTQGRGGQGVRTLDRSRLQDTGPIAAATVVDPGEDVALISTSGIVIRVPVSGILSRGRATRGGVIMDLRQADAVASVARLKTALT